MGFDYHYEKEFDFKYTPSGTLEKGTIVGYNGGVQSAIGLVGVFDSRDNVINAHKGTLLEASSYFYRKPIGSTFNFTYFNLLYQKYWQLKPKQVLAIQVKARYGFGEVPFLDLSAVGNDDLLRGYPKNRFKDVNFIGGQTEYRFPLFWRLGMVAFAGAGDVFNTHKNLSVSKIKYSVGTGLRFLVNPVERLNIRLDYGYGREGGYYYFVVAESF
ncbi:MAG: BamA/TamA family outer membrane protein [Bacteroidia bacterium]